MWEYEAASIPALSGASILVLSWSEPGVALVVSMSISAASNVTPYLHTYANNL